MWCSKPNKVLPQGDCRGETVMSATYQSCAGGLHERSWEVTAWKINAGMGTRIVKMVVVVEMHCQAASPHWAPGGASCTSDTPADVVRHALLVCRSQRP